MTAVNTDTERDQIFAALELAGLNSEDYQTVYEDFADVSDEASETMSLEMMADLESCD